MNAFVSNSLLDIENIDKKIDDILVDSESIEKFCKKYCLNKINSESISYPIMANYFEPTAGDNILAMELRQAKTWSMCLKNNMVFFSGTLPKASKIVWLVSMDKMFTIPKWLQYMSQKFDYEVCVLKGMKYYERFF